MIQCGACQVWQQIENDINMGICKRHAPSPRVYADQQDNIGPGMNRAFWPHTSIQDGCFEGIPRPIIFAELSEPKSGFKIPLSSGPSFNDVVEKAKEAYGR